jgi:hypothetical protein
MVKVWFWQGVYIEGFGWGHTVAAKKGVHVALHVLGDVLGEVLGELAADPSVIDREGNAVLWQREGLSKWWS